MFVESKENFQGLFIPFFSVYEWEEEELLLLLLILIDFSGQIECSEPIEVVSYKIGVCKVSSKGKSCSTTFEKLGYSSSTNTSIVLCKPHTGRMHQIRVHLQYLGMF